MKTRVIVGPPARTGPPESTNPTETTITQNARSLTLTELDRVNGGGGTLADAKAVQTALPLRASGRMQTLGEALAALTNELSGLLH